jgi:hypothetical protein
MQIFIMMFTRTPHLPKTSVDINQYYSVVKDLNFIAERTSNTNVGFVNLLRDMTSCGRMGKLGV